ncbi:MAG: glycosyltransferase [Nitrospirae bacterium]|nr:glycosyltransferase [Nitrospirota bacterium]
MKILFISGREPSYVRNAMILKGLKRQGVEILDCTDSSASYLTRYITSLRKYILARNNKFDFVFIGFFGQPLVPIIGKLTSKPIIFDAFLSAYDTLCFDRKKFKPTSPTGRFFYWLDKYSCESSDRILLDTNAHIDYFIDTFGLKRDKFQRIFVGADDSIFYPRDVKKEDHRFRVFYYATYLPLHGMEYIIQAAKNLEQTEKIEFKIVGKGPQHIKIRDLARRMGIKNITFIDWIPYENLPLEIGQADVCLGGHFSDIEKAKRVIAGKTYQFIAMKKPVIVGDCPGNRELFTHKGNALLVKMADADSLANAVLELRENESLREQIAEAGYKTFVERCNIDAIGRELERIIGGLN